MLGAFYSGASGLKNNKLWLDVVGENLANVNTTGYKKSRISFEDVLSQTLRTAIKGTGNSGGVNPMQVGLGSRTATIEVVQSDGQLETTGINTDLAIRGVGFFILNDGMSAINRYTRAGTFNFDSDGNLVNASNGYKVLGWNAVRNSSTNQLVIDSLTGQTTIKTSGAPYGIKIVQGDRMPGRATKNIALKNDLKGDNPLAAEFGSPLTFYKNVRSSVTLNVAVDQSWANAGFERTPQGKVYVNGEEFTLNAYGTVQGLLDAINNKFRNVIKIEYNPTTDPKKFVIGSLTGNIDISLGEDRTDGTGFFSQARIRAGGTDPSTFVAYDSAGKVKVGLTHILEPDNPDKFYLRWQALNPSTDEVINTNAYYFMNDDPLTGEGSIQGGVVAGEILGISDGQRIVFNLANPDIDPNSLQVYVMTSTGAVVTTTLLTQTKLGSGDSGYYFDDNGLTQSINYIYHPSTDTWSAFWTTINTSENGVDRIILTDMPMANLVGAQFIANYTRKGYNLHKSSVDPAMLKVNVNGEDRGPEWYTFNNNQGVGGVDQVNFYSGISSSPVTWNNLKTDVSFAVAGFNSPYVGISTWMVNHVVSGVATLGGALTSYITIRWGGTREWQSARLRTYTIDDLEAAIYNGTSGVVTFDYDEIKDKFTLHTTQAITMFQSNNAGLFTVAKLTGEYTMYTAATAPLTNELINLAANTILESRDEICLDRLDTSKNFNRAGFNNHTGFDNMGGSALIISWMNSTGAMTSWTTVQTLSDYLSVNEFIYDVNQAVSTNDANPSPVTIRYDEKKDRFVVTNTNSTTRITQTDANGFLTKARLFTTSVGAVTVPVSVVEQSDTVTADYYYNKSVIGQGILELNADGKVINNYGDTEATPEIISSAKVISSSARGVNLSGGWDQFDSGTVNGTITIETLSGAYISREISSTNYRRVQDLLDEINTSSARVMIEYNSSVDKFVIKSRREGDEINLRETGTIPFFSEINVTTGTVTGGNNNGVMDLTLEVPSARDRWIDTTGIGGAGKDYFRINVIDPEVVGTSLGVAGEGKPGTQVAIERHDLSTTASWSITLSNADVAYSSILVWDTTNSRIIPPGSWTFSNNTGDGGRDKIIFQALSNSDMEISYRRLNAFDFSSPDVDQTKLIVRVANVLLEEGTDYIFADNEGADGVDRIYILKSTAGSGDVIVDYRLTGLEPIRAVDIFIPNGNEGPENIAFSANTGIRYTNGDFYPQTVDSQIGISLTGVNLSAQVDKKETLYDSFGNGYETTFIFERLSTNKWLWTATNPVENDKFAGYGILVFDGYGAYNSANSQIFESPSDNSTTRGNRFKGIYFDPPSFIHRGGSPPHREGVEPVVITPSFDEISQYTSNTIDIYSQDGYATGRLNETKICSDGSIIGNYDNEKSQILAKMALALFSNGVGLEKLDGNTFGETVNSGNARIGVAGEGGLGTILPGQLERSNVDLVEEFTSMIIAQRAFQANSRTITTADSILEEILSLKR